MNENRAYSDSKQLSSPMLRHMLVNCLVFIIEPLSPQARIPRGNRLIAAGLRSMLLRNA